MRYFLVSATVHLAAISLIWVGFSVTQAGERNSFTYLGDLVSTTRGSLQTLNSNQVIQTTDGMLFDQESTSNFSPWLKMRDLNKPR